MAKFPALVDRVAARFLNDVNDASIGGNPAPFLISNPVGGQLGDICPLTAAQAAQLSDTVIGTLYEGLYMYVQIDPSATAAGTVRGQLTFWKDFENYIVSIDAPSATTMSLFAGVALCVVTKGNYGWIQTAGKASVKFSAAVTDTTAGDLAIVDQAPANTGNTIADATSVTGKINKSAIGICIAAPSSGAISTVLLNRGPSYF
jgi:hypothetical protein